MVREALRLGLCAALLFGPALAPAAGSGDEPDARIRTQLAVQAAFQKGLDLLQKGNPAEAVSVLEAQLPYIDGNRPYLVALRDAYRGHVVALQRANRLPEAQNYLKRLDILDPNARREIGLAPPAPVASVADRGAAPAPAEAVIPTAPPSAVPAARPLASLASVPSAVAPDRVVAPSSMMARGVRSDDEGRDPFDPANRAPDPAAAGLLDRAERAFAAHHFDEAGQLYEQTYRAEPDSTRECKPRWAYCKLFLVAQQLNRLEAAPGDDLAQEVRTALSLAPREMDGFGRDLLKKIAERADAGPRAEVRHTPRPGGTGWALAETTSFRIFHTQNQAFAERAAQVAEATRLAMSRRWFGEAEPERWAPRCDIYLYASARDYAHATGAPADSPGHSTVSLDKGRVIARKIDLRCDDPNLLTGVLPHETTHVVLAGHFGAHHVPRWADEGMAVLSEPRDRVGLHLANLPTHRAQGDLFAAGPLMEMDEYPEPRRVGAFYAESVSLVDFLSRRKSPPVFARFLRDGLDHGYDAALRKHYEINGKDELDRLWRDQTFGGSVATAGKR